MKYLKTFNEKLNWFGKMKSNDFNSNTIRDCFVDLEDVGFKIEITQFSPSGLKVCISKPISNSDKIFYYNEIDETLSFAIPYLKDECSLVVNKVSFDYPSMKLKNRKNEFTNFNKFVKTIKVDGSLTFLVLSFKKN